MQEQSKTPFLVLLLAIVLFLPVNILWFYERPIWFPWKCYLNGLLITVFLFIPSLLYHKITKIWACLITIICTLAALLQGLHIYFFQTNISKQSLFALFETNINESFEFIWSHFSIFAFIYALLIIFIPLLILITICKSTYYQSRYSLLLGIFFSIICLILHYTSYDEKTYLERLCLDNPIYQIYRSIIEYRQSSIDINIYKEYIKTRKVPYISIQSPNNITIVVLIGESSSRHHWSLYGYHRNTTPLMKSISDELFIYTDAISPFGRTTPSVASALTCSNVEGVGDIPLTNIFHQAGFETIWISNQHTLDDSNRIAQCVANCDKSYHINRGGDYGYSNSFDEMIFPVLTQALNDKKYSKKIIFIHTMGSHVNYASRFPKTFSKLKDTKDIIEKYWFTNKSKKYINDYDNSILYTDYIIYNTIDLLKKHENTALIYFSDHGEEVFDTKQHHGHHDSIESRYYVDIPFIIWLSDSYKKVFPNHFIDIIKKSVNLPFINDTSPYFSLLLSGLRFNSKNFNTCPIDDSFTIRDRIIHGINYDKTYFGTNGVTHPVENYVKID